MQATAAEELMPLQYMLQVMRDPQSTPAARMDAAKNAAPYLHPKLATTEFKARGLDQMGEALLELVQRAQQGGGGVGGLVKKA